MHIYGFIELGLVPILGLPVLVGGCLSQRRDARALRCSRRPPVRAASGDAGIGVFTSDTFCQVIAGDPEFSVSAKMAGAFEPGRCCTLYVPRPRQLLYAEPAVRDEPVDS